MRRHQDGHPHGLQGGHSSSRGPRLAASHRGGHHHKRGQLRRWQGGGRPQPLASRGHGIGGTQLGPHGTGGSVGKGQGQGIGPAGRQQIIQAGFIGPPQQGQASDRHPAPSGPQGIGQGPGSLAHLCGGGGPALRIEGDQPGAAGPNGAALPGVTGGQCPQGRDQAGRSIGPHPAAHGDARQRHSRPASPHGGEGLFEAFADQQL